MKYLRKFTMAAALALLAFCTPPAAQAQEQFGVNKVLWSASSITNVAGQTTNLAATVTTAKWGEFELDVVIGITNASAGSYDIAWQTSNDGTSWGNAGQTFGHFAIPATNAGTVIRWRTNIVNTAGFWRANWGTNNLVQHITNAQIKAYVKPRRYGGFGP